MDTGDAKDLMDLLRYRIWAHRHRTAVSARWGVARHLLRSVNTGQPAQDVIAQQFPWCEPHTAAILDLIRGYIGPQTRAGRPRLRRPAAELAGAAGRPGVGARDGRPFRSTSLVDEYQDVNQIQVDIVRLLCPDGVGLTVVGDDAQAVYGFRGADGRHLLELSTDLPNARTVCLEQNFRSRQRILAFANEIRPASRRGARLWLRSDRDGGPRPRLQRCYGASAEARLVVDTVLAAAEEGRPLKSQAVLMRAAHHGDLLEVELTARRVPFVKFGGLKFLEAAHVKDFIASVRLLENTRDEIAWYRLLRLHDGAIGPARARAVLDALAPGEPDTRTAPFAGCRRGTAAARTKIAATLDVLAAARGQATVADRAEQLLEMLRPLLTARYPDHLARLSDLDRLVGAAADSPTLADYVANLTLDPPASTSDLAEAAPPGRGLPGLVDRALGQGPGMGQRPRHPRHRRRVSVGPRVDQQQRVGGGTAAVLRGRHPGPRRVDRVHAAADAAPPAGPG